MINWVTVIESHSVCCAVSRFVVLRPAVCMLCCVALQCVLCVVGCGVVWCGVVWCGVVWCGVVWCGVVWCGVVWCGMVWCGVETHSLSVLICITCIICSRNSISLAFLWTNIWINSSGLALLDLSTPNNITDWGKGYNYSRYYGHSRDRNLVSAIARVRNSGVRKRISFFCENGDH